MPQIQLNHACHRPDCLGNDGDVVDVSGEVAALMVARGGAKRLPTGPDNVETAAKLTGQPANRKPKPKAE